MNTKVLFHLGMHKTATTSLQKDFFIRENCFFQNPNGRDFCLPIFVNKFSTEKINSYDRFILDEFTKSAHKLKYIPVISHERLSGYPISGGYDRFSIYNRIASLDLNAKILIVIREQKSWLYSAWRQMVNDGASISLQDFITEKPIFNNSRMPAPRFEYLNYDQEIDTLNSLFGKDNVLMFPLELIMSDFKLFIKKLTKLLNETININIETLSHKNEASTLSSLYLKLLINRLVISYPKSNSRQFSNQILFSTFLYKLSNKIANGLPEIPFSKNIIKRHKKVISKEVGNYFKNSNKNCEKKINFNLTKLGYDT